MSNDPRSTPHKLPKPPRTAAANAASMIVNPKFRSRLDRGATNIPASAASPADKPHAARLIRPVRTPYISAVSGSLASALSWRPKLL